eukprot:TRINITY_DN8393_c0_g1_i1.p1 TRINITY_DN8393_c0_g1~~TRINITY_DN8393_c0_g1_i1.p1  ORF type:complete len:215 (-),score=48.07 TRINITY_DN8393_c0_g1_i1:30-674(-)
MSIAAPNFGYYVLVPYGVEYFALVSVIRLIKQEHKGIMHLFSVNSEVDGGSSNQFPGAQNSEDVAWKKTKIPGVRLMRQVLADPDLLERFERFMVQEFAVENVYFLKAVEKYRKAVHLLETSELLSMATSIYNDYCDTKAELAVNISSEHRAAVKSQIDTGSVPLELFEHCEAEIMHLVAQDSLRRFWRIETSGAVLLHDTTSTLKTEPRGVSV